MKEHSLLYFDNLMALQIDSYDGDKYTNSRQGL